MKGRIPKRAAIVAAAGFVLLTGVASSGCDSVIIVTMPSATAGGVGGNRPSLQALVNLTCLVHAQPVADLIVIVSSPGVNVFVDVVSLQSSAGTSIVTFRGPHSTRNSGTPWCTRARAVASG